MSRPQLLHATPRRRRRRRRKSRRRRREGRACAAYLLRLLSFRNNKNYCDSIPAGRGRAVSRPTTTTTVFRLVPAARRVLQILMLIGAVWPPTSEFRFVTNFCSPPLVSFTRRTDDRCYPPAGVAAFILSYIACLGSQRTAASAACAPSSPRLEYTPNRTPPLGTHMTVRARIGISSPPPSLSIRYTFWVCFSVESLHLERNVTVGGNDFGLSPTQVGACGNVF